MDLITKSRLHQTILLLFIVIILKLGIASRARHIQILNKVLVCRSIIKVIIHTHFGTIIQIIEKVFRVPRIELILSHFYISQGALLGHVGPWPRIVDYTGVIVRVLLAPLGVSLKINVILCNVLLLVLLVILQSILVRLSAQLLIWSLSKLARHPATSQTRSTDAITQWW